MLQGALGAAQVPVFIRSYKAFTTEQILRADVIIRTWMYIIITKSTIKRIGHFVMHHPGFVIAFLHLFSLNLVEVAKPSLKSCFGSW